MRIFGILLCLTALGLTGYSALTYKAPKIEADIERRMVKALSALTDEQIDVRVDGRHATRSGRVSDEERRQRVLDVTAAVPGVLGPIDNLERLELVSPYRFGAVKGEDGRVTVEGLAPTSEARASIATDARAIFGDEASIDIELAAGAPAGDWHAATSLALDALATMRRGKLSITDSNVVLEGEVAGEADVEAIDIFAETMPDGFIWTHDVGVHQEPVTPFTFSVVKDPDGGLWLSGFAPDEDTRAALIEQGKAIGGDNPVIADIQIKGGMPDQEWPFLVHAGISAMKDMEAGRFDVIDNDVSFSSDPGSIDDGGEDAAGDLAEQPAPNPLFAEAATSPPPAADGPVDAAASPSASESAPPTPVLTVDKVDEGVWSVRGVVPDRQSKDQLVAAVKEHADVEDVEIELALAGGELDDDWLRFATDHIPTLHEVSAGRLSLDDYQAHLIGVVETPEDIEPVKAALAAIDQSMDVDLQPIDPRPIATIDLRLSRDDGVVLVGALPEGMSEGEALLALGIQRYDGKLEDNGRGRVEVWREDLSAIGTVLPAFEEIDLSLGGERPKIRGRVHAKSDADEIARQLVLALSDDRQPLVDVETSTTLHEDGAGRTNPLTGEVEVHHRGHWLPAVELDAGVEACDERSSAILAEDKITFGRGQGDLDQRARTILDALAALALVCLDETDLVLEIGGHTDSRGGAEMNRELSQARADAVLDALAARGVDARALIAVGYGDNQPIADNATDEGRAANRRISFEWKASAEVRRAEAEG